VRRNILLIALVLVALVAAGAAQAKDKTPAPASGVTFIPQLVGDVVCGGDCGGSGYAGCGTAGSFGYDSHTDGRVWAWFHWCWNGYSIWDGYGWSSHDDPCCAPAREWRGWDYDYGFGNGRRVQGQFAIQSWAPWIGWYTVYSAHPSAGICVNEYGGYWGC